MNYIEATKLRDMISRSPAKAWGYLEYLDHTTGDDYSSIPNDDDEVCKVALHIFDQLNPMIAMLH